MQEDSTNDTKYMVFVIDIEHFSRCGLCVGGETGHLDTDGMDSCKVCGGDNSCVGCDNVVGSNKTSDACGACLELDDEMRDSKFMVTDGTRYSLLDESYSADEKITFYY
jgi:hypothetical protein